MTPGHMSLPVEREVRMRLTGPGIPAIVYRGGGIEKEALTATGTAAAVTSEWGTACVGSIFQKRVVAQAPHWGDDEATSRARSPSQAGHQQTPGGDTGREETQN